MSGRFQTILWRKQSKLTLYHWYESEKFPDLKKQFFECVIKANLQKNFVGCFKNDVNFGKDFQHRAEISSREVTVQRCFYYCMRNKFRFALLQNGQKKCLCGNSYTENSKKYSLVADAECRNRASSKERNEIYSICLSMTFIKNF